MAARVFPDDYAIAEEAYDGKDGLLCVPCGFAVQLDGRDPGERLFADDLHERARDLYDESGDPTLECERCGDAIVGVA